MADPYKLYGFGSGLGGGLLVFFPSELSSEVARCGLGTGAAIGHAGSSSREPPMTEAEWTETCSPIRLLDNGSIRPSKRQHRLIAIASCRTIGIDMVGENGERWLATAETLAEKAEIRVTTRNVERWWRDFWDERATPFTHPNLQGMYLMVGLGDSRATILNAGFVRATATKNYDVVDGELAGIVREVLGNPFRPATFSPSWRTSTTVALAFQMYESRDFSAMPILADALQDAGCDNDDILNHCRGPGAHVRGC